MTCSTQISIFPRDYCDCLIEQRVDCLLFLIPPRRVPSLLPWIGEQRAKAFSAISTSYQSRLELDGRDHYYYHFLVWDPVKHSLIGGQRLLFVGQDHRPFDQITGDNSYLEHCYPAFASVMAQAEIPYAEIGRTFVMPEYQRGTWLLELIRAFVCLPEAYGINVAFGMISFNHLALSADCIVAFLSILENSFADTAFLPVLPQPRFPWTDSDHVYRIEELGLQSIADIERYLRGIDAAFVMPPVLKPYSRYCSVQYLGASVAKSYNQIMQLLFCGASDRISSSQRYFLKPYSLPGL